MTFNVQPKNSFQKKNVQPKNEKVQQSEQKKKEKMIQKCHFIKIKK